MDYRWKGGDDQGIEIVSAEMAQFDLTGVKTRTKSQTNSKGNKIMKVKQDIYFNFLTPKFQRIAILSLLYEKWF